MPTMALLKATITGVFSANKGDSNGRLILPTLSTFTAIVTNKNTADDGEIMCVFTAEIRYEYFRRWRPRRMRMLPTIATRDAYTADHGDGDDTLYGLR